MEEKERKELLRLVAERNENLKKFRGPQYTKFKFDCYLSEYQRTIIFKIIEYVNSFETHDEKLRMLWESYGLPFPENCTSFENLLDEIRTHSYFCIQDLNCKLYIDYSSHKQYVPSILMNEYIKNMDNAVAEFRKVGNVYGESIERLSYTLTSLLKLINSNIAQFQLYNSFEFGNEPTWEEYISFYPDREFFKKASDLHEDVCTCVTLHDELPGDAPEKILEAINAHLLMEKQLCAFSALCGLLLDATAGTDIFFKPLRIIENVLRYVFHDSELYRLELPVSHVDTTLPVGSRGQDAHTTIMKLFLIDKNDNRVIIRIDLPHVRSPKFHFNIITPDNKSYNKLNHFEIEADQQDDELNQVLDNLKISILEQMPNLHVVADTDCVDEKQILEDMKKLNDYRHMCLNYIVGEDTDKQAKKVAGYLHLPVDIECLIERAGHHYRL